jgi:chorismate synthase
MGSIYGNNVRVSLFGQSHSTAIGVVIDGLPPGFAPDFEQLSAFMQRRTPGQTILSTTRREEDQFEILSGIVDGKTCGAPLSAVIRNTNVRPGDYPDFHVTPRPGHADYTAQVKYKGHQDKTGGGHFSGRLTAPLCFAGGIMKQMLGAEGIKIGAHIRRIANVDDSPFDPVNPQLHEIKTGYLSVLDEAAAHGMARVIDDARMDLDSVGGIIECAAVGLPAGVGEPMFDGLENRIAQAIFGIPAVRGIEFGAGFSCAGMRGSKHNDAFAADGGRVVTSTNNHGGILGGISSGMPILFRVAFKPTASIFKTQNTVNLATMENATLAIKGRHDPCVVPRAVPVVEAACAMAIFDALLDRRKERSYGFE